MRKTLILLITLALIAGCKEEKHFQVELKHFFGAEGYTVHYFLNQDSLMLRYNCDFENCKDTLLYQTRLDNQKANEFYQFLSTLKIDTLKDKYETSGFDGRHTTIKASFGNSKVKEVNLKRFRHSIIERLIDKVDSLIPINKYRLYSHKYKG